MLTDLDKFLLSCDADILTAMALIDENTSGIVLGVDAEGRLVGTATDGDIRRGILRGVPTQAPLHEVLCRSPHVVDVHTPPLEIERLFRDLKLRQIPVVDDEQRPVGLHLLSEWVQTPAAVIMAGGLGTRLRPLTDTVPKPLIEVGGKPILERIVEHLRAGGINDLVITTRYLAEQIEDYFGDGERWQMAINYIREQERQGTGGALRHLKGQVDQPFLVMNGDLLTDVNVRHMFDFHRAHNAVMTIGVRHYTFQVPYGVVELDDVHVHSLSEKPTYDFFVNAGIYVLSPRALELVPDEGYFDITELVDRLLAQGLPVVSFPIIERWYDIGRPEDLEQVSLELAPCPPLPRSAYETVEGAPVEMAASERETA